MLAKHNSYFLLICANHRVKKGGENRIKKLKKTLNLIWNKFTNGRCIYASWFRS